MTRTSWTAAELMTAPRGTDPRLDLNPRRTTSQRRERYHERMDAKAEARAELKKLTPANYIGTAVELAKTI